MKGGDVRGQRTLLCGEGDVREGRGHCCAGVNVKGVGSEHYCEGAEHTDVR